MPPKKNQIVKSILVRRGIRQKDIAEELGILTSTVSGVLNGHHHSRRIQEYIAERLKLDYEKLWEKAA
jgi:transcriptional regulator with XRE-family HTH domain